MLVGISIGFIEQTNTRLVFGKNGNSQAVAGVQLVSKKP